VVERIAAKHALAASGHFDLRAGGELATDRHQQRPEAPPVSREVATMMRKAGLDSGRAYPERELDQALATSGLSAMERIAVKHSVLSRPQMSAAADRSALLSLQASARCPRPTRIPGTLRGYSW